MRLAPLLKVFGSQPYVMCFLPPSANWIRVSFAYFLFVKFGTFWEKEIWAWRLLSKTLRPTNPVSSGGLFAPMSFTRGGDV